MLIWQNGFVSFAELDGYQLRRMVSDVERNCGNKTDLAKKVIRILSRPPKEERDEERKREKERRSAGQSSSGYAAMSHAVSHTKHTKCRM